MEKINKMEDILSIEKRPQKKYAVKIWDTETGEILYQDESLAGIVCTVEEVKSFGAEMEGTHQVGGWGNPMASWYALDQSNKWFNKNFDRFVSACIASGVLKGDPEQIRQMFKNIIK